MDVNPGPVSYTIMPKPEDSTANKPCYRIETSIDETDPENPETTILANGYNICNKGCNVQETGRKTQNDQLGRPPAHHRGGDRDFGGPHDGF